MSTDSEPQLPSLRVAKLPLPELKRECKESHAFSWIGEQVLPLLKKPDRASHIKELCQLLHPIFAYYISFYLSYFHIYKNHEEYDDYYQEVYWNCIELLKGMKCDDTTDFNRIKRYVNKSIYGWLFNIRFKKKKRCIELTYEDIMDRTDSQDFSKEVDHALDLLRLEGHVKVQYGIFSELVSFLLKSHRTVLAHSRALFRTYVYDQYRTTGALVTAEDYFSFKFGGLFAEAKSL